MKITTWATTLMVAMTVALPRAADTDVTPPQVPGILVVGPEYKPYLIGHAFGTQNYVCAPSASGVAWTLYGPQATLFDEANEQLMTHFLSPNPAENGTPPRATWQHSRDTSSVWAVAEQIYTEPDYVAPGAIPWLLLRVVGARFGPNAGDKLVETKYIQRVNTAGGVAPATGCAVTTDLGKRALVPYTTDYVFYKLR
jgi:Protein of unknown function (DUF3455)